MPMKEPLNASPARVAYHGKQLRKLFARATDQQILQMMWAVGALRLGRPDAAARFLTFPRAATDQSLGSQYAIHEWEVETLLIQLFLATKTKVPAISTFDSSKFGSVADLVNRL